jgi:hypothetical protein
VINTSTQRMAARGLRSASELAKARPHGDRLRYIAGCRCQECRRANTAYETARAKARKAGDWNGIVPAARARAHLNALSAAGVGRRQVTDASGIAETTLQLIAAGRRTNLRARTERSILAVTTQALADHALVDAGPMWRLLDDLLASGYAKAELARALGYETGAIQFKRTQCTVRNAYDVERLHARLRRVPATPSKLLLAELREEGYRPDKVEAMLEELAARLGKDKPQMDTGSGFILASTAALIQQLHHDLTEVPA